MKVLTDDPKYFRDMNSSALVAKDHKALEKHRQKVKQINDIKTETKEINNLKKEVQEMKETLNSILDLLTKERNGNF
jgi:hypothetical protein